MFIMDEWLHKWMDGLDEERTDKIFITFCSSLSIVAPLSKRDATLRST